MKSESNQLPDFYELLGVAHDASPSDLKRAYRALAQKYHPDTGHADSVDAFVQVTEAYETLIDPDLRNAYNKSKGFEYFDDADLPRTDSIAQDSNRVQSQEVKVEGGIANSAQKWSALHQKVSDGDLKVGHKVALSKPPEEETELPSEEDVTPWGEPDGEGSGKFRISSSIHNLLGVFKRKGLSQKRRYLKERLRQSLDEEMHPKQPARPQRTKPTAPRSHDESRDSGGEFRGDRVFQFQITSVERVLGTSRDIALPTSESTQDNRRIKVRIPPGAPHGSVIEVSRGWERFLARINVIPDPWYAVDGNDLVAYVPITFGEAVFGASFDIAGLDGNVRLVIPAGHPAGEAIVITGKGIADSGAGSAPGAETGNGPMPGVMKVYPYVVPPNNTTPMLREAVKVLNDAQSARSMRQAYASQPNAPQFLHTFEQGAHLFVPALFSELIEGTVLDVRTPQGTIRQEIAGPWVEETPIILPRSGPAGSANQPVDLVVRPLAVLSAQLTPEVQSAAMAIEQHYLAGVRSRTPRRLRPPAED